MIHVYQNGDYFGYGPYVKEMNLWAKHIDELWVLAPLQRHGSPDPIDLSYIHPRIKFIEVPSFQITSASHILSAFWASLVVLIKGIFYSAQADHLHLRCPGNMGLLACFIQIFFPWKQKTAKYAGNWDRSAPKPWSYKLQQWILNNTFLTKRMKVLAYGAWPDQSRNILPFFTASYSENQISDVVKPTTNDEIRLIFVGSMTPNKSPEKAYWVAKELLKKYENVNLNFLGKGPELDRLQKLSIEEGVQNRIHFLGNVPGEKVIDEFKKAHFLIFASKSEGWPKVVAEAMFWGCIPVTTPVSCVPEMLGFGERGFLIGQDQSPMLDYFYELIESPQKFATVSKKAMDWSRQYTLESFEKSLSELL